MRIILPILSGAALSLWAGAGFALDVKSFYDTCFSRTYDEAHLSKHPGQKVTDIHVSFQEFEDNLNAQVRYKIRGEAVSRGVSGDCYKAIPGGVSCEVCKNDSCESNGERFKILLRDKDTIELVNDSTGITAAVLNDQDPSPQEKLPAGGEHRAFVMKKAPAEACSASQ